MNELFYFSPFVFMNALDDKLLLQTGYHFQMSIDYDKKLVDAILDNRGFTIMELLTWFDHKQIVALFQNNILVENQLNDDSRYSRTNGYFLVSNRDSAAGVLAEKRVLVLGAGAIGSHVAWMLTTLGIRKMAILDFDCVEESNLNRQLLYTEADIGRPKAEAIKAHLLSVNSGIYIEAFVDKISSKEQLRNYVGSGFDFVVRAIDTPYQAAQWLNEVCVELKIPYTSGGFLEYYGVVGPTYVPNLTPCYACYKNDAGQQQRLYGTGPTISMLTEYVASKVTFEVVNVLTKNKPAYCGQMEIYDSVKNTVKFDIFERKQLCEICGKKEAVTQRSQDVISLSILYFLFTGALGFLVSTVGWSLYKTIIGFVGLALYTLLFHEEAVAYRVALLGGTLYGILSLALTLRLNGSVFATSDYLAGQIITIGLQMIITISISITTFFSLSAVLRFALESLWKSIKASLKRRENIDRK